MRELVDLVDAVAGTFTRTIWLLIVGAIAVVAIVSLTVGLTAPKVIEQVGERAERLGEKAIVAERDRQRAQMLARDGWGDPPAAGTSAGARPADRDRRDPGGGWGVAADD